MKQIAVIKKVSIDSDLKVSILFEFVADNVDSKNNIFEIVKMQGNAVEISLSQSQLPLFNQE